MRKNINNLFQQLCMYWNIHRSGLFDRAYYLRNNLDVAKECKDPLWHYIRCGWKEGRDPNPKFRIREYIKKYPDALKTGVNPFIHYMKTSKSVKLSDRGTLATNDRPLSLVPKPVDAININKSITIDLLVEIKTNMHREMYGQ